MFDTFEIITITITHQERHEDQVDTCSNEDGTDGWNIPRNACVLACPPQPKGSNDKARTRNHRTIQTFFGWWEALPPRNELRVVTRTKVVDEGTQRGTNTNTNEDEAVLPDREAPCLDKDDGNCFKYCRKM